MKITSIETKPVSIELHKPFKTALRTATTIETLQVKIILENGQEGLGAASSTERITGDSLVSIEQIINGPMKELLLYRDIEKIETLLSELQQTVVGNTSAKAAVDIALHDAYSQLYQLPLYQLLGGETNKIETDITIGIDEPSIMHEEAKSLTNQGYSALKIKVGHSEELDLERIRSVRQAVGSEALLRLDANQGWDSKQAVRLIQKLEDDNLGIELVEQPVSAHDFSGLKFIRERVNTPIMADESIFSPYDTLRLLKEEAVDLLNIKLMKCGGIRRAYQIADIAEAAGVECMIGSMMESSISVTAAAHLATAHKNITRYDLDAPLWLKNEIFKGGMQFDGKHVSLDEAPGLGLEEQ
ncbi:dipeptide epimerase [Alteribacillus iranensis]|uniref:Dipeptide epimerase n=1 Tax=Alteribacillus iranensis TaxID=930128 RepID=A0A1I2EBA5_9BACI|nr:dipeptide epimerase [Alteribacillus iranensis]SFE89957.1 o-succinylbenzoate synthase [Alteribacillus iranensis]